jgi:hypothetical protein
MYEFQKTIHQKETQRIKESIIEKEKWVYDLIICDRVWLWNTLYANQNYTWNKMSRPKFFKEDPGEDFYDHIFLLTDPIKDSLKEEFDIYWEDRFKKKFNLVIRWYYWDTVETFRNWKKDRDIIMNRVLEIIKS